MTIQNLRDGLAELAAPVTRGVAFEDLAQRVGRARRRRANLGALVVAVLVGTASSFILLRDTSPAATQLANEGPITITLPETQARILARTVGDQRQGVRLSTYPVGNDALIQVGVRGNGWTCVTGYLASGASGLSGANSCGLGPSATEPGSADVIYPGFSIGLGPDGKQHAVISGAGPSGTTRIVLRAANGQTLDVPVYDSGPEWGHKAYFAVPWITGTTVIRALDDTGQELACGTTAKGSRCTDSPVTSTAVPYDVTKAPAWFVHRTPLRSCGSYLLGKSATLPKEALRCFTTALGANGVELTYARITTEGDPVVTYVRALPGTSTVVIITDSTRDRFGPRQWSSEMCDGFNVGTLMAKRCRPLTQQ